MREVERQVMLQIIDQKWREHLYEMDYLQEGIHLRAYGQKDPLVEWQHEGFEMFGMMMKGIALDFVKYVMHAEVSVADQAPTEDIDLSSFSDTAPTDPSETNNMAAAAAVEAAANAEAGVDGGGAAPAPAEPDPDVVQTPIVKSDMEKTGRNEPCPCGSGKKFKNCHGAA
jgi:preprotein translocase subunit SecA